MLFDPARAVGLSRALLPEQVDDIPYARFKLRGYPSLTVARGRSVCADGEWVGPLGPRRLLVRGAHDRHTDSA